MFGFKTDVKRLLWERSQTRYDEEKQLGRLSKECQQIE